jgi:RNA polymerase sigma-70 factor (ECF subfamily)
MSENETESHFVGLLTDVQLPLRLYVQSLLPGDPGAKDVAQHANATIWRKRAEFAPGTNFKAWVFSIARFEVLNYRKQQVRDAHLVFSEDLAETFAEELAMTRDDSDQRQEALRHCLLRLGDPRRLLGPDRANRRRAEGDASPSAQRPAGVHPEAT